MTSTPLPEQGGFNEKLDELIRFDIDQHDKDCGVTITRDYGNCDCSKTELKAAIRTLIREEIIGEDETSLSDDYAELHKWVYAAQNKLRAEQRKKLEDTHE